MLSCRQFQNLVRVRFITVRHESTSTPKLSGPQLSRAAACAIRKSIAQSTNAAGLRDAYFIINSLRHSHYLEAGKHIDFIPGLKMAVARFDPIAIKFNQAVPLRLSYHALLHSLMRAKLSKKAYRLAQAMLHCGIPLHTRTLETLVRELVPTTHESGIETVKDWASFFVNPKMMPFHPRMTNHPGTRYALQIMQSAHRYRQQKTMGTWATIIAGCLLNGEIILGSLLLGAMIKDWREHVPSSSQQAESPPVPLPLARIEIPKDATLLLKSSHSLLLSHINSILSSDSSTPEERQDAFQALFTLTDLLWHSELPLFLQTPLIVTLAKLPKLRRIQIIHRHRMTSTVKTIYAYSFFHRTLSRLLHHPKKRRKLLKAPDILNTLINHVLTHRLSTKFANLLLKEVRYPDIVLYNILIRAATLLRRNDIVEECLECLASDDMVQLFIKEYTPTHQESISLKGRRYLIGVQAPLFIPKPVGPLKADMYTITSILRFFISSGRPDLVGNIVMKLLPELAPVRAVKAEEWEERQQALVARALDLGPRFLTVALNGLEKAGRTGLAEGLWLLAKTAERESWNLEPNEDGTPRAWCLPIHAYTTMIRVYAREAKKGIWIQSEGETTRQRPNRYVIGWARRLKTISRRRRSRIFYRWQTGKILAFRIYRGAREMLEELNQTRVAAHLRHLEPPKADARFFNSLLAILGRRNPKGRRGRRSQQMRLIRHRRQVYARTGLTAKQLSREERQLLREVCNDIEQAGYAVPLGVLANLVGSGDDTAFLRRAREEKKYMPRQPKKWPWVRARFSPHLIVTYKNKGLPLRN